jgi:hypothetical protein
MVSVASKYTGVGVNVAGTVVKVTVSVGVPDAAAVGEAEIEVTVGVLVAGLQAAKNNIVKARMGQYFLIGMILAQAQPVVHRGKVPGPVSREK